MMTAGWVSMMAAMMLPSALPAIARRVRDRDGVLAAPLFAGPYAGIWALVDGAAASGCARGSRSGWPALARAPA